MVVELPSLRQLEYALAVAEHGHFGRAAEALHVSQPGLSAQVAELEKRLGIVLFERSRTGTAPTPGGRAVLEHAATVVRAATDLVRVAQLQRGSLQGRIALGAIPTIAPYLLPAVARQLRVEWPDVDLALEELRTAELVRAVSTGRLDLGFLATPVDTEGLTVAELTTEPFVLAVADDHPLARGTGPVGLDALDHVDLLLMEDGHCLRDHVLAACTTAGAGRRREVHNAGLSVLAQMVATSSAATLLPACAVPVEARPGTGLVTRPFTGMGVGRTLSLVWRPTDPRRTLFALAATALREALGRDGSARTA